LLKDTTEAACTTFKLSTHPVEGMRIDASASAASAGDTPSLSLPTNSTTGWVGKNTSAALGEYIEDVFSKHIVRIIKTRKVERAKVNL
jgi:hypothetical protein